MTRRTRLCIEALEDRCLLSFTPLASYDAVASAVIAADFNNDDIADLALDSGDVLLGHGDGTFDSPALSGGGGSIAVGDLDGDGNLDLVLPDWYDVSVRLGNGDGTFADAGVFNVVDPASGDGLSSVAVGDFDGNGLLDLGVVSTSVRIGYDERYEPIFGYVSSVHVLVGSGDGTFSGPSRTSLGEGFYTSAAAADFSGDGIDDLAMIAPTFGGISVVLGDSSGVLQGPTLYFTYAGSRALAVADVDGDLDTDLVVASPYGNVGVLLGDGAGGFADAQYYWVRNYAVGSDPVAVAVADFNGDGALDIAITSNTYPNYTGQIDVFLGYGDGTFASTINQSLGAESYVIALAADDFDGDGLSDVAVTLVEASPFHLNVLINAGGWVFPPTLAIGDVTVTEGNAGTVNATFTVTLSAAYSQSVTVNYSTANGTATAGSDYVAKTGTLTFAPGETTKTITVAVLGDQMYEPNETFVVNLSGATNATITDGNGLGTIVNDDTYVAPSISISDVSKAEGRNGSTLFKFTVTLSAPSATPVTVNYSTANGTATALDDYTAASGTLTFAPGETTKTITIRVKGDRKREADETFFVNLFGVSSNATIFDAQGLGTILNDD
jgi:hypothetical protein